MKRLATLVCIAAAALVVLSILRRARPVAVLRVPESQSITPPLQRSPAQFPDSEGEDSRVEVSSQFVPEPSLGVEGEATEQETDEEVELRLVSLESGAPIRFESATVRVADGSVSVDQRDGVHVRVAHAALQDPVGVRVRVDAPGYCPLVAYLDSASGQRRFVLPMKSGVRVQGVVLDRAGSPIGRAKVSLTPGSSGVAVRSFRERAPGLPPGVFYPWPSEAGFSDEDGKFLFDGIPGKGKGFEVAVEAAGHVVKTVTVPPQISDSVHVEVVMGFGSSMSGRLQLSPQVPCGVVVRDANGRREASLESDPPRYRVDGLVAGDAVVYVVQASGEQVLYEEVVPILPEEAKVHDLVVNLDLLQGTVVDSNGLPVIGAEVYVRQESNSRAVITGAGAVRRGASQGYAVTGSGGHFALRRPTGSEPFVVVAQSGYLEQERTVDRQQIDVTLVLAAGGSMRFRCLASSGSVYAGSAHVMWWPSGSDRRDSPLGMASNVQASDAGWIAVDVPVGEYDCMLLPKDHSSEVVSGVVVLAGEVSEAEVFFLEGTELTIRFASPLPASWNSLFVLNERQEARATRDLALHYLEVWPQRVLVSLDRQTGVVRHLPPGRYRMGGLPAKVEVAPPSFEIPAFLPSKEISCTFGGEF